MARNNALARQHLDARAQRLRPLARDPRPRRGWIRAIRDALGMSTTELARRLELSQQSVSDLERSEQHETIRLSTLRRVADALDCDLVYALIPRTSLDDATRTQARRKAADHLRTAAHHSRLEDQTVDAADAASQLDELAARLIDKRGLWTTPTRDR